MSLNLFDPNHGRMQSRVQPPSPNCSPGNWPVANAVPIVYKLLLMLLLIDCLMLQ